MRTVITIFKHAATAILAWVGICLSVFAQDVDLDDLMRQLADPATENWEQVERQIRTEWSRSGSPSMDLLMQRGEKALVDQDFNKALEHFTALTDHAPDFAAGWNGRATALYNVELYGPAMEDLGKALALNPQHFQALTGVAVILQKVEKFDQALEAWLMVQALHPHRPELKEAIRDLRARVEGTSL